MPVLIVIVVWVVILTIIATTSSRASSRRRPTISSDGHMIPKQSDPTCEGQYGHNHAPQTERRYIVHDEPNQGYVILNGVKRKIEDCKYL